MSYYNGMTLSGRDILINHDTEIAPATRWDEPIVSHEVTHAPLHGPNAHDPMAHVPVVQWHGATQKE